MKNIKALLLQLDFITTLFCISLFPAGQISAESVTGTLPHKTDFLTFPYCVENPAGSTACNSTWYPRWYPTATNSERTSFINALKNSGYTHWYISVVSSSHNYFDGGTADQDAFKAMLQFLSTNGIKPVVWLTSDTGTWKDKTVSSINSDLSIFIPAIDSLVNSYVLGIEIDEYWTLAESDQIGAHLDSLTSKPLAAHQLPGRVNYCTNWCDYMIYQYGFGKTEQQIVDITRSLLGTFSKPLVAGEYYTDEASSGYENNSKALGNAAVCQAVVGANGTCVTNPSPCVAGFGNGGLATNVKYPNCDSGGPTITPSPSPPFTLTPTPSVNQAPIALDQSVSTVMDKPISIQLQFSDLDGPGPYTFVVSVLPTHGHITGTDNDLMYTPNAGFTGTDSLQWRVNDSIADSNAATVTVSVISVTPTAIPTPLPGDGLVSNLTVASGLAYEVVVDGLAVGALQYLDRSFTFSTVPSQLVGLTYIKTANDDKAATGDNFLSFTVSAPVTLFVAHDDRISPRPVWLSTFSDTGDNLISGGGTFSLFAKEYPQGPVTLGGNEGDGNSMYSLILLPHATPLPGDYDQDGDVDFADVKAFLAQSIFTIFNYTSLVAHYGL